MEYLSLLLAGLSLGCILGWILCQVYINKKKLNKVHFYITRDKDGREYLWLGKPLRNIDKWVGFESWRFNAKIQDFIYMKISQKIIFNLKWEDEPVEVFLNLED